MFRKFKPVLFIAMLSYIIVTVLLSSCEVPEKDYGTNWPMWRYDSNHSAASPVELPTQLYLQWERELSKPCPAFPDEQALLFDASYEPVVMDKMIFVPSMISDNVTAYDTTTGDEKWKFYTDGPVRFAPVAWRDKVYFVSDDGYLYCLNASKGKLLWKFSGKPAGPKDLKLLGNQRLISRWPARGGPVLYDGTIYFTAGIFPFEGVYVYALDAETGKMVWLNKDISLIKDGLLDHDARRDGGLSPQGYLTIIGEKLIVPGGKALPGFFDPKTGEMEPYTSGWGGRAFLAKGNWYVTGIGRYYFQNGDLYSLTSRDNPQKYTGSMRVNYLSVYFSVEGHSESQYVLANRPRLQVDPANQKHTGVFRDPVFTKDAVYYSRPINKKIGDNFRLVGDGYDGIMAYDINDYKLVDREDNISNIDVKWKTTVFFELWRFPSNLKVHIKAGSRLYAGNSGVVAAVDIPETINDEPKISWKAEIKGTPFRMLAADDKLFVVTEEGRIYCFGGNKVQPKVYTMKSSRASSAADEWTKKAGDILRLTGVTEGYSLSIGVGTGRLVEELARQSDLHIIVIDSNAQRINDARYKLDEMGLYGSRVHIVQGDLSSVQLPRYMASLVISENLNGAVLKQGQVFVEKIFDSMRPYGGVACLPISKEEHETFTGWMRGNELPRAEVKREGDFTLLIREGALPGSADWSHVCADAGNTFTSKDKLVKGPLSVLWFGGSIDSIFPDFDYTHSQHPIPLVVSGRMFIQVRNELHAADIYTGRHLWTTVLPSLERNRAGYNYAAAEDGVYVVFGEKCLIFDPTTGSMLGQINIPEVLTKEEPAFWQEIRIQKDFLIGVIDKYLLCMDRRSGEIIWKFQCQHNISSFSIGNDKVFCIDYTPLNRKGVNKEEGKIIALSTRSGEVLWQKSVRRGFQPHLAYNDLSDILLSVMLTEHYSEKASAYSGKGGDLLWTKEIPNCSPFILHRDLLITYPGEMYDLRTGSLLPKRLWTRTNRNWNAGGTRGCGHAIANEHMIIIRDAYSHCFDMVTGSHIYIRGVRSGCTPSLIPANGLLNAPNYARGCSCNYGLFTSLALEHMQVLCRETR